MNSALLRTLTATAAAVLGTMLVASTALAVGASAASGASPATSPATAPPWEPDPDSVGALIFYNSSGQVVTGGSTTESPVAAYVEGTKTLRSGDTKVSLFGYLPVKGQTTGEWSGEQLGSTTAFPNTSAPAPLKTSTLPVETGSPGDETLAELEEDFPNLDTSNDGYAGMYQLRLRTSRPDEGLTITYDSADIKITGSTWSVVYSPAPTTTTLSVSPASAANHGSTVKLTATVTPSAAAGSVEFRDGSKILKTVTVASGKASYSTDTLADGVQKLSAKFVPTDAGTYRSSTSSAHDITVSARATTTSLKASSSTITEGKSLTLTAKESPSTAGSVTFYSGTKKLAAVKVSKGEAKYASTKYAVGSRSFKATFTPSNTADYKQSTSKVVSVKVEK
jgi:hypothetical protein